VLIREKAETDPEYGKKPIERPVPDLLELGFVVLDKPSGHTSHEVAGWAKNMLGATRAGHSGTLDPGVTGVLPIFLNRATKVVEALKGAPKTYVGVMKLHGDYGLEGVRKVAAGFVGKIKQTPPVKSAVKREEREREVYSFQILEADGRLVLFETKVEAGTYIRKLCHDLGQKLGEGAHMAELRRTLAGPFTEEDAVTLQELSEAWNWFKESGDEKLLRKVVRPVEDAVAHLPKIVMKDSAVNNVCHGSRLGVNGVSKVDETVVADGRVALLTLKGELVALGTALLDGHQIKDTWEGDAATADGVVMARNAYPASWRKQKHK